MCKDRLPTNRTIKTWVILERTKRDLVDTMRNVGVLAPFSLRDVVSCRCLVDPNKRASNVWVTEFHESVWHAVVTQP